MNPNNIPVPPSKAKKALLLVATIVAALLVPVFLQGHLNVIFRDLFNPPGWIVLVPVLRVMSTLVCYGLTAAAGWALLRLSRIRKAWLDVLFLVLTFLWTGFVALVLYLLI